MDLNLRSFSKLLNEHLDVPWFDNSFIYGIYSNESFNILFFPYSYLIVWYMGLNSKLFNNFEPKT